MNYFTRLSDSLFNLISGLGTAKDPTSAARFRLHLLDRNTVEEMYRSDWVSRKIVDAPAEDATREWRQWEGDKEELGAIQGTEDKHKIQQKMRQALIRARLYGGAALVFAIKGQDPAEELDYDTVGKGDLDFVVVMNRYELMAGPRIFNVESPWYTRPEYYTVATPVFGFVGERGNQYPTPEVNRPSAIATTPGAGTGRSVAPPESVQTMAATGHSDPRRQMTPPIMGTVKVHPSRVIEFTGNELPDWRLVPMGGGWGDSILQTVDEVLKDIGLVIGGIANMVNDAKVDVIKIPDFSKQIATSEYANRLLARFSYANQAKSTVNSILLDTDEEWQRVQSNFGSLPNILHEYLVLAGGAADIPMSRLIGQTGGRGMQGMSSGGDSGGGNDLRNYYDRIAARQKTIYTPAMQPLDICIVRDALGKYDATYTYEWNPLWQMDDETKAKVAVDKATAVKHDVEMGLINEDVLRQTRIAQLIEDGFYPGLEDAVDEFGAEPEEPDIEVPWSRLAGAMQALGGPQPPQPSGNGNGGNGGGNGNGGGGNAPRGGGNGNRGGGGNATALAGTVPYSKVQNYLTGQKDAADQVTKSSVNYRDAPEGAEQRCGNCSMYHDHACTLVRGLIDPQDVCDRWASKEPDGDKLPGAQKDAESRMRTVQLIRHGATKLNNDDVSVDRIRGWKDVPLSADGRDEAEKIGKKLKGNGTPDVIHTSDLKRAADTAKILSEHCGTDDVRTTRGLRPWDLGELSGQTTKEALPVIAKYVDDDPDKAVPGGESFNSFKGRTFKALHRIVTQSDPDHAVALVTHHRVERLVKAWQKAGYPEDGSIDLGEFKQRGEHTGNVENIDLPIDRLQKVAKEG